MLFLIESAENFSREYGQVWENKLTEYWADLSISNVETGRRLGVSQSAVGRHAIRLNLPMNTENTRSLQGHLRHRNPNKSLSLMREDHRNEWLEVIRNNPDKTRRELMHIDIFLYLWLKRNDADWYEQHLPPVKRSNRKGEKLDWKKIDKKLARKVKNVCDEIMSIKTFPVRVSITEIIRRVGNKKWIEKRHLRLPETSRIIDEKLESLEDYMIRKLKLAETKFLGEKVIPSRNQLIRRAVIENYTTKNSKRIQNEVTLSLNRIEQSITVSKVF